MSAERLVSVVIPVRNEAGNIEECVRGVSGALAAVLHEILVVFDSDDDDTLPVVERMAPRPSSLHLVRNSLGRGPSLAIRAGIREAKGDIVIVMMADQSDPPSALPSLVRAIDGGADLVVASRYMPGGHQLGGPVVKKLLSRIAGLSLRWIAGVRTHDATTSFRALHRRFVQGVQLESRTGFAVSLEITVKAHRLGHVIREIPVTWRDRTVGSSQFRVGAWLGAYLRWYALAMLEPALVWGGFAAVILSSCSRALEPPAVAAWLGGIAVALWVRHIRARMRVVDVTLPLLAAATLLASAGELRIVAAALTLSGWGALIAWTRASSR